MTEQEQPMSTPASAAETGPWQVTLVHSNDDSIAATFPTLEAATVWVRAEEGKRHRDHSVFDATFTSQRDDYIQHGTGYHWVTFERVTSPTPLLPQSAGNQPTGTPTRPSVNPRHAVARALYRRHKMVEGQRNGNPDPEVYAGWFPWENLGTGQADWLDLADTAIAALTTAAKDRNDA